MSTIKRKPNRIVKRPGAAAVIPIPCGIGSVKATRNCVECARPSVMTSTGHFFCYICWIIFN